MRLVGRQKGDTTNLRFLITNSTFMSLTFSHLCRKSRKSEIPSRDCCAGIQVVAKSFAESISREALSSTCAYGYFYKRQYDEPHEVATTTRRISILKGDPS